MDELARYLLRSSACLALFYGAYWLFLRKETSFALNRAFLIGAAVLSLVLPFVRIPSPFSETVIYASVDLSALGASAPAAPLKAAGVPGYVLGGYAIGVSVLLVLFAVRLGRLALLAGRSGCERRRGLRVIVCGHPGESFSFFNYVFLKEAGLPAADMDRILAHELAHVKQGHSFDILFAEILTIIQWFNPFVWPYKRSLRETHEYLADRAVIAQGCSPARYQLLIVEQHVGGRLFELASSFRTSQIKRRMAMLTKQETKGLARWKPLLILPLALALVLAFAESRTVIKEGPAITAPAQDIQKAKAEDQERQSDEQTLKALQEKMQQLELKMAELEFMKQQIALDMAKLKMKLATGVDVAVREKVRFEFDEQQLKELDIIVKKRMLEIKELEAVLAKETDPAKKDDLKNALEELKAETEQYMKKAEQLRKTAEKQAAAEKKLEKK